MLHLVLLPITSPLIQRFTEVLERVVDVAFVPPTHQTEVTTERTIAQKPAAKQVERSAIVKPSPAETNKLVPSRLIMRKINDQLVLSKDFDPEVDFKAARHPLMLLRSSDAHRCAGARFRECARSANAMPRPDQVIWKVIGSFRTKKSCAL